MLSRSKPLKPTPPELRQQIETILSWFSDGEVSIPQPWPNHAKPTSSKARPFLVLCASDLVTLVKALFPEQHPSSGPGTSVTQQPGFRSTSSPAVENLLPVQDWWSSRPGIDETSVRSNCDSSVISESPSREPSLEPFGQRPDGMSSYTSVTSHDTLLESQPPDSRESLGDRLRAHIAQLPAYLGLDAVTAVVHPCKESWAVIYIQDDGIRLTTVMPADADESLPHTLEPADWVPRDVGHKMRQTGIDPHRAYHQIKETLTCLVDEYHVPGEISSHGKFLRRTEDRERPETAGLTSMDHSLPDLLGLSSVRTSPNSPGYLRTSEHATGMTQAMETGSKSLGLQTSPRSSELLSMLESVIARCQADLDFVKASTYWATLQKLQTLSSSTLAHNNYASLLYALVQAPRQYIRRTTRAIEGYNEWLVWLQQSQGQSESVLDDLIRRVDRMRDKVWYDTDVRHSAAFEDAKNVATALRFMGEAPRTSRIKPSLPFLPRHFSRAHDSGVLLKSEVQVVALLAAAIEHGGLGKLSDDQSEMTSRWLEQRNIENVCKGEERIHRFCLEIDRCVTRLVGPEISGAPVLWSSDLFSRDKRVFESGHQPGDLGVTEFGTLVVTGRNRSLGRGSSGPLRGVGDWTRRPLHSVAHPDSTLQQQQQQQQQQHAIEPGSFRGAGRRNTVEFLPSYRNLATGSQPAGTDVPVTFWSPFIHQSETVAPGNHGRQILGTLHGEYLPRGSRDISAKQRKFLSDLQQTLTGLLLSDLGAVVWGRGSETDSWLSSTLGEEFLRRRDRGLQRVAENAPGDALSLPGDGPDQEVGPPQAITPHLNESANFIPSQSFSTPTASTKGNAAVTAQAAPEFSTVEKSSNNEKPTATPTITTAEPDLLSPEPERPTESTRQTSNTASTEAPTSIGVEPVPIPSVAQGSVQPRETVHAEGVDTLTTVNPSSINVATAISQPELKVPEVVVQPLGLIDTLAPANAVISSIEPVRTLSQPEDIVQPPEMVDPTASSLETAMNIPSPKTGQSESASFSFEESFRQLLRLFTAHFNPFMKLDILEQLASLIEVYLRDQASPENYPRLKSTLGSRPQGNLDHGPPMTPSNSEFQDSNSGSSRHGIAYCEGRSSPTTIHRDISPFRRRDSAVSNDFDGLSSAPDVVSTLQRLFRDPETRPRSLFRDLQFIAAFVPHQVLDETSRGTAFWKASLAALDLKQGVCRMMVKVADNIVAYHTKTRPIPSSYATVKDRPSTELSRFSMADAARMLTIPAKEGDPVAQRELAILYLTHPDLVARTTMPLSKPRETFKAQMMNLSDGNPARSDPATICVAYHWMEHSSRGGDELARQNLRAKEELNALP